MTTAYPLAWPDGWPRTPAHRRKPAGILKAPFHVSVARAQNVVRLLGSRTLVVSSNLQLRVDGLPRADQADTFIPDPGIAIYFSLRDKPMVIAQDVYAKPRANLQSLALALEYLRGLERHGGGHMMERAFGGFSALPPPKGAATPAERPWREILGPLPDGLDNADMLMLAEARYRAKAREAHPDSGGGNETMIALNAAITRAREELA